jgi:hypothetical protein
LFASCDLVAVHPAYILLFSLLRLPPSPPGVFFWIAIPDALLARGALQCAGGLAHVVGPFNNTSLFYFEYSNPNINKAVALKWLADDCGMTMQNTVAFGDSPWPFVNFSPFPPLLCWQTVPRLAIRLQRTLLSLLLCGA